MGFLAGLNNIKIIIKMTDTPIGFHRLNTAEMNGTYVKGHVYFNSATGAIYLAKGTAPGDLELFSSDVKSVTYSPSEKKLTIIKKAGGATITVDMSVFAEKTQIGDLSGLSTENKTDLVSAINEVRASIEAGGTGSVVTITEKSPEGYAKSYEFKQGSTLIGTINIPKDMVVSSGTVETNPDGKPQGTYLVLTLANATSDKIYINVGTLVDLYTAAQNAAQVQLTVNPDTREISASIVAGSIGSTELAANAVTLAKIADGAVSYQKLDSALQILISGKLEVGSITTGQSDGSIAVNGTDVPVKGLGTAAYKAASDFATPTDVSGALQQAKEYADGLNEWATWEE